MKIKNHMQKRGRRIQEMMGSTFGIDTAFLIKCCEGDEESLQQLGQMGREGALISKLMPKVRGSALSTIKGTEDFNVGLADIITQAASSSLAIGKASANVALSQKRYQNGREEVALDFTTSKEVENLRHSQTIDYIKLNAWIEKNMMRVDGNVRLLETANKPELRQIDADIAHKGKVADHLLKYGDISKPDLIPKKQYKGRGIGEAIALIKQVILGF